MPVFTIFTNEPDVRTFTAGQTIFAEGDPGDGHMFAVLDGEVDIIRSNKPLATVASGGVFGEMALIDHEPRSAGAVARTDCRVAAITDQRFMRLVSQNPHFALDMMRLLTERIRHNEVS
jgi:CRP-like cAMP-binding protein